MRKVTVGILLAIIGVMIFVSPVSAQSTNNFTISSFDVEMKLGRDTERRSTLAIKETIVAEFPESDQNHGLERAFVKEYDGHGLSFELKSVTDEHGEALTYRWMGDVLRIGDADTYVHGKNTYVISYTMRDVTKFFKDVNRDELYWDVLGTDWTVSISQAQVKVILDGQLQGALTGDAACYVGALGSTTRCEMAQDGVEFSAAASGLRAREGMTMAIGFAAGTFAAYEPTQMERAVQIWAVVQMIVTPIGLVYLIWWLIRWYGRLNRTKELGTIVPEYIPPQGASVTTSAKIGSYHGSVVTAQMLDFAVRHYIKIYEVKPAKSIWRPAEYEIEVIRDVGGLRAEEQELLKDTFGALPIVGQRLNLKELQKDTSYYQRTLNNAKDLNVLIRGEYELRERDERATVSARRSAAWALLLAIVLLSFAWMVVAIVLFVVSFSAWRLTDKGLVLKRYLEGLKLYISVAETERLRMLQSPEGAQKVQSLGDVASDPKLLVTLYERVLPYAVLFGREKEWNKQLGVYYETAGNSPDWYIGQSAFNAAVFSSAMSSFSQASASSYSSSSSGSSGGGFSGGGGGGGGGGGW